MKGRVLIVAGSDSGGGAGIQADIKAVTALRGYAATAITALTAQDTRDVHAIHEIPPDFVRKQIQVVLADIGADCLKTGMLHRVEILDVVADALEAEGEGLSLVMDPVMVAKGGARLLNEDTMEVLARRLLPKARLLTPNVPEAEILAGATIRDEADMVDVGQALRARGPAAVLMKGGHMTGDRLANLLITADGVTRFESERIETRNTHGTGCTLASAIACGLAQGLDMASAVGRAGDYVHRAILSAPGFGAGHGPVDHAHTIPETP